MKLKTQINKQEFFNKLIKSGCRFKKICGLYPASCKSVKYIGNLIDFKTVEVYQITDTEADFFKKLFKTFPDAKIEIAKVKNNER